MKIRIIDNEWGILDYLSYDGQVLGSEKVGQYRRGRLILPPIPHPYNPLTDPLSPIPYPRAEGDAQQSQLKSFHLPRSTFHAPKALLDTNYTTKAPVRALLLCCVYLGIIYNSKSHTAPCRRLRQKP